MTILIIEPLDDNDEQTITIDGEPVLTGETWQVALWLLEHSQDDEAQS